MRAIALSLLLLAVTAPVMADSLNVGNRVLVDGDSVGKAYELLGKPDRVVQLENKFGAGMGERLEWYRNGKTIQIIVRGGRITSIYESSN